MLRYLIYVTTRCTVDDLLSGPLLSVFSLARITLKLGTWDTSLVLKEGSHSPALSSIPLARYILRTGELDTIMLDDGFL